MLKCAIKAVNIILILFRESRLHTQRSTRLILQNYDFIKMSHQKQTIDHDGLIFACLKPRANGRNIVGQQLPTLLDVTCCIRLRTLLHVVACCCVLLRKV